MRHLRRALVAVMAIALVSPLAACGQTGGGGGKSIGMLLPEKGTARYEAFDRPATEAKVKELCPDCTFEYANADDDAKQQEKQFDEMLSKGVGVILLDPVDASVTSPWVDRAKEKDIPVVAYDRLAQGDIVAYVSYDNFRVGYLQGKALLEELGDDASDSRVVMINGSPSDPNSASFKAGAHEALDKSVDIVFEKDIDDWSPKLAQKNMTEAIDALGEDGFDAVYSANDGMAAGVIKAMKSAGITDKLVGGQDAELAAMQRIVAGEQTFTAYKPLVPQAETAADIAVRLLKGKFFEVLAPHLVNSPTTDNIPSAQLEPIIVTERNVTDTVIEDGVYSNEDICTDDFAKDCAKLGITG